jgi:hypothetical protein
LSEIKNTQGQIHKPSLHSSITITITPTTTPAYIDLTVASPSTNQVGAIGRGGSLGWRQSGKVIITAIQRSWVQSPSRPERLKEMIKGQSKEKKTSEKKRKKSGKARSQSKTEK